MRAMWTITTRVTAPSSSETHMSPSCVAGAVMQIEEEEEEEEEEFYKLRQD